MQADFGEGGATASDVVSAYRVLLGREAESASVIAVKAAQPFSDVVGGLLASDELADVVDAIGAGRGLGDRYTGLPTPEDAAWASARLPLTPETADALGEARTWRDLLCVLFADARFGPRVDALEPAWPRAGFLSALDAWAPPDPTLGARDSDWGESIAERTAAMKRDTAERLRFELPPADRDAPPGPLISVLTPVYQSPLEFLARAVDSVRAQTYGRWELILVDDGSPKPTVRSLLEAYAALDDRIRIVLLPENAGIAAASNAGLEIARGEWLALLDHDDMLTRDALEHVAAAVRGRPDADLVYSDEAFIGEDDAPQDLFPKPDWSPLLMLNGHYIGHLTAHRTERVRALGGFRSAYDFSQDYDLALRVADDPAAVVVHVDRVLYGWRRIEGSAAAGGKDFARRTNIAALQDALDRRGWGGFAEALPTANRARRRPSPTARVGIIVPSDDAQNITAAVRSITERTWWERYEVFVVTNSPLAAELRATLSHPRLRWVAYDRPFNFSDKCNAGAAAAAEAGVEHLVFFNDDVRVITPDWIESLLEVATLPGVGAVGAKLLYEDGRVQHAGMVTGVRRLVGTAFHMREADTHELSNLAVQSVREVSLLCAALMMMRADLYAELGGFDAVDFPVAHSDVDLCLRIRERGLSLVYTPHAVLSHLGHVSIGAEERADAGAGAKPKDKADIRMLRRFPEALRRDPFFPEAMRGLHHRDSETRFALHPGAARAGIGGGGRDVLLVSHELTRSGAPQLILDMARVLVSEGCRVVVASRRDGPMRERIQALGVPVIVDSRLLTDDRDVLDFGRNFDTVIANTVVSWPAVRLLAPVTEVIWYLQEVDLIARYAAEQPRMLDALPLAREIWAPSRLAAEALAPFGASARLVPYGVDDVGAQPAPENPRVRICVLGAYERRKGQDLALEAWRLLPPELQAAGELVFWGRALEDDHHAALVERARGVDGVRIEGELPHADALAALRGSDAVFVPSREESMSLVALDGLSAGRPVICSRRVGASAWLEAGVSGLICDAPEPEAFAALLARVVADAPLRARLGRGGREVFSREFTHEAFRRRLRDALGAHAWAAPGADRAGA